jgi:hypothetical protein
MWLADCRARPLRGLLLPSGRVHAELRRLEMPCGRTNPDIDSAAHARRPTRGAAPGRAAGLSPACGNGWHQYLRTRQGPPTVPLFGLAGRGPPLARSLPLRRRPPPSLRSSHRRRRTVGRTGPAPPLSGGHSSSRSPHAVSAAAVAPSDCLPSAPETGRPAVWPTAAVRAGARERPRVRLPEGARRVFDRFVQRHGRCPPEFGTRLSLPLLAQQIIGRLRTLCLRPRRGEHRGALPVRVPARVPHP